jgi:predicted aspartyl protease
MALEPVESDQFPYLPMTLVVANKSIAIDALLDTGFDGDVIVPTTLASELGPPDDYRGWALADDSVVATPTYYGQARFGAVRRVRLV